VQDLLGERMGAEIFMYSITLQPEFDSPAILGIMPGSGMFALAGGS
jgi:hypothetical protein